MTSPNDDYRTQVIAGPIFRTIVRLAAPVTFGMLMEVALSITDFYWVGKLGAASQDAITSSMVVVWTFFAAVSIISIGVTALVSRYVGAGNTEQAAAVVRQGITLALLLGGTILIAGVAGTPWIMRFMKAPPDTYAQAVPYLRIFFLATPLFAIAETIYAVFRASGDTRTPMRIGVLVVLINIGLDPLFIFGAGPVPRLGVPGAGLATFVSIVCGTVLVVRALRRDRLGYPVPRPLAVRPEGRSLWRIARIGLPIAAQQLVFVMVYWFLIRVVHEFGETAGAAMGIGNRMESFSYLTCYGISLAASTMVGQNLGAGQPDRAARCAWGATATGVGITLAISALFLLVPELIAGVFTDDPAVLRIAVDYLRILGLSQFSMAVEIILEGAFSGAGDTLPPMIVMVPGSLARIPLAYLLAFEFGLGINGVWWTLTITTLVKAAILALWFARGGWKTRRV